MKAKGHTEVTDKAVAATCTQAGKTEGKHCSACHTTLIAQTTIQPTGNHSGQYVCTGCNTSFFDMTKELLIKRGGSYSSNNYKITYNSSENRIEIVYTKTSNNTSRDKYTFLVYILENSSSLVWGYSHEYDKLGFSNGQYIYQGTAEEYMVGEIICSSVSTSTSTLDYTYNTFSTQYSYISGAGYTSWAEIAKGNAATYLRNSIAALDGMIENYGNGEFALYNLGFSQY